MKAVFSVLLAGMIFAETQGQVPLLNSYPSAAAVIYLDFDGQYVQGTSWNWAGPIDAQPAGLTTAAMNEIWMRVSEDYRIFNVNVTTDSAVYWSAPIRQRIRIIITPTYQWYGMAGGVSYVGSFTWGDNTPGWVFSGLLSNNAKYIAEAASHEAGHTLGLQHQSSFDGGCNKLAEYYGGQGAGEIGWAPIMGVGYSKNITTWYNGTSTFGCTYFQNDINIIGGSPNNFGFRADDHADTYNAATPLLISSGNFLASGIINNAGDRDVFSFDITSASRFQLNAVPENVGLGNAGANVDIKVSLLNQQGDTLAWYNPSDLLNAGVDTSLNAGRYYLVMDGIYNINMSDYGSLGFYQLNGSLGGSLPVHRLVLTGSENKSLHLLNWSFTADEAIKQVEPESSTDGLHFSSLAVLNAKATSFTNLPASGGILYYRVKVTTVQDERAYYSNIIALENAIAPRKRVPATLVNNFVMVNAEQPFYYALFNEQGQLLQQGRMGTGSNQISLTNVKSGLLYLRLMGEKQVFTEKIIKQ